MVLIHGQHLYLAGRVDGRSKLAHYLCIFISLRPFHRFYLLYHSFAGWNVEIIITVLFCQDVVVVLWLRVQLNAFPKSWSRAGYQTVIFWHFPASSASSTNMLHHLHKNPTNSHAFYRLTPSRICPREKCARKLWDLFVFPKSTLWYFDFAFHVESNVERSALKEERIRLLLKRIDYLSGMVAGNIKISSCRDCTVRSCAIQS